MIAVPVKVFGKKRTGNKDDYCNRDYKCASPFKHYDVTTENLGREKESERSILPAGYPEPVLSGVLSPLLIWSESGWCGMDVTVLELPVAVCRSGSELQCQFERLKREMEDLRREVVELRHQAGYWKATRVHALPSPGISVFQRTFRDSLHSMGGLPRGATPVASGPRH